MLKVQKRRLELENQIQELEKDKQELEQRVKSIEKELRKLSPQLTEVTTVLGTADGHSTSYTFSIAQPEGIANPHGLTFGPPSWVRFWVDGWRYCTQSVDVLGKDICFRGPCKIKDVKQATGGAWSEKEEQLRLWFAVPPDAGSTIELIYWKEVEQL